MSFAFDPNEIAAAALGARASKPVAPMEARGGRQLATVRMLALSDVTSQGKMRKVVMMVADMPGEAVVPKMNVRILNNGRIARFPVTFKDAEAQAEAKRARDAGDNSIKQIQRHTAGTFDVELGTTVVVTLGLKETEAPRGGREYVVGVSEVLLSDFGLQFTSTSFKKGAELTEMSVPRYQMVMAAALHAAQCNPHLQPLIYTGAVLPKEKLKMAPLTPESRMLKNSALVMPLVRDMPPFVFSARMVRGMRSFFFPDPALSILNAVHWPQMVTNAEGKTEPVPRVEYRLDVVEKSPRDVHAGSRPTRPQDFADAYNTYEPSCRVTVAGVHTVASFGVADDRHWFDHGALRYLVVATPAAVPVFCSGDPLHESQVVSSVTQFQLGFRNTGAKDTPTQYGVHAFLFEGVMNAGYPVSHKAMRELLVALAGNAKWGKRYAADMAAVHRRNRKQTIIDTDMEIPEHRAQIIGDTSLVVNILETSDSVSMLPTDQWMFVVVPNLAAKCETSNSLGYACLRELVDEHGEEHAAEVLGDAFVSLARNNVAAGPANVVRAFCPETPREFNFLLFAVSRAAIAEAGYSIASSRNHVGALQRIYEKMYPADMSDMTDVEPVDPVTFAALSGNNKRAADDDTVQPAAKTVPRADEEMAGVDAADFADD